MGDINLLPEELREKEKKELKSVKKTPKSFKIEMTSPAPDLKSKPLPKPKPSLLSRLFTKKIAPTKLIDPPPPVKPPKEELNFSRPTKKTFHIPRPDKARNKTELSASSASKFVFGKQGRMESDTSGSSPLSPLATETTEKKLVDETEKVIEIIEKSPKPKEEPGFKIFGWLKSKRSKSKKTKESENIEDQDADREIPAGKKRKRKLLSAKKKGFGINLIPKELAQQQELALPKKLITGGIIILASASIIGAAYLGITWYQVRIDQQIQELESDIENLDIQLAKYESIKVESSILRQQLELVEGLLDNHIYWTKFFELLESYTLEEIYYLNFSMAGTERLNLSAIGTDYGSVARQLIAFQQATDFISDVEINAAEAEIDENGNYLRVRFSVNLTFQPGIFLKPIE